MNNDPQSTSMATKKTIYLIRHGETEFNRLGMVQGSGVDSDLNENGQQQAGFFYEKYGEVPFEHIYTSALKRTHQSVASFLQKKLPHTILPDLNEISWGEYEGFQSNYDWKAEYFRMIAEWKRGNLHYSVPGGETPLQLQERQKRALQHILSKQEEGTILICMHGRALKSFLCLMMNKPLNEMEDFTHDNLGLYQLEYESGSFSILKTNDLSHLKRIEQV